MYYLLRDKLIEYVAHITSSGCKQKPYNCYSLNVVNVNRGATSIPSLLAVILFCFYITSPFKRYMRVICNSPYQSVHVYD